MRQTPQRRHAAETYSPPPSPRSLWRRLVDDPIALFTAVLSIFTCILTIVGGIQAWAFIASERAFVSVTSLDLSRIANAPDQPIEIPLFAVDSGRSSARVTAFNVTLMTSLPPTPQYIPLSHFSIKPLMVNTPEILLYRASPGPSLCKLSKAEIDKIESGEQQLFIFGSVRYRDGYSLWGDAETVFCFRYIPRQSTPTRHLAICD